MNSVMNKKSKWIMFTICAGLLFIIMYCSPLASDDYELLNLDLNKLDECIHFVLYYGNGRLLGNLGSVVLVHFKTLSAIVRSIIISSIIMLIPSLLDCKARSSYFLSFLLLVGISPSLFGEVYSWVCGFNNYIPPIWISLLILYIIKKNASESNKLKSVLIILIIFVLGICSELYIEHTSIVNVAVAGMLFYFSTKNRIKSKKSYYFVWLLSTLTGLAVMFAIPILFWEKTNEISSYRSLSISNISLLLKSTIKNTFSLLRFLHNNLLIFLIIAIVIAEFVIKRKSCKKGFNKVALYGLFFSYIFIFLENILVEASWTGYVRYFTYIFICFCMILILGCFIYILYRNFKNQKEQMGLFILAALFSILPLLIVNPLSLRVIYCFYIVLTSVVLKYWDNVFIQNNITQIDILQKGLFSISLVLGSILILLFANIKWLDNTRTTEIQAQMDKGAKEITIFKIPYSYCFWDTVWGYRRYYYYNEQQDIVFKH